MFNFIDTYGEFVQIEEYLPKGVYEIDLYKEYNEYVQGYTQVNVTAIKQEGRWEDGTNTREFEHIGYVGSTEKFTIEVTGVDNNSEVFVEVYKYVYDKEFEEGNGAILVTSKWEGEFGGEIFKQAIGVAEGDQVVDIDAEVLKSEDIRTPLAKNFEVGEVRVGGVVVTDEYLVDGNVNVNVPNKRVTEVDIKLEEVV